jgi:FixJ family two-component response regulator
VNYRPLIAVVDDDASVCKALQRLLRSSNMDALTYSSARDFLDNGEAHHPDCIVLDIQMPEMSGVALRDELNTRPHRTPVIFITAHDDKDALEKAMTGGAVAHLRKPFTDEELLAMIAKALGTGQEVVK